MLQVNVGVRSLRRQISTETRDEHGDEACPHNINYIYEACGRRKLKARRRNSSLASGSLRSVPNRSQSGVVECEHCGARKKNRTFVRRMRSQDQYSLIFFSSLSYLRLHEGVGQLLPQAG